MAYSKTTWANGDVITATKLNNIETGVYTNDSNIGNLSNLTTTAKNNLVAAINEAAQSGGGGGVTVDSALSTSSTNPVQNKVITNALPASASISSGVISYKNSSGTTLFTVTLPLYNGGIG